VREGESGFLIPVGDFETLVDRMDRLAADPARAKRMGEAGKPLVEEFSARTMAHQLEDLYAELLSRGARPGARAE
jgi:glycosyltransferase involved in cell wall biosynthesis